MAAYPTCLFTSFAKSVMSRLVPLTLAQRAEMQVLINQGIDPVEARALVQSYVQKAGDFDESKHPRDHGKFSEGAGSSGPSTPEPNGGKSLVAQRHLENAKASFDRADRHLARAKELKAEGNHQAAQGHLTNARDANAAGRRELTQEKTAHDAHNARRVAEGKQAVAHDDKAHAELTRRHEENRAKITAEKPLTGKDKAERAATHQEAAEQSLGRARAAEIQGDKEQAKAHMQEAQRHADQAEREVRGPLVGDAAAQNQQMQSKIRNSVVQSQMKDGVDKKKLQQAQSAQSRAQAHDKAAERHGMAGHTERASHHATEAAHARHEAGNHLHEFGKLLAEAADKSLEKSAGPKRTSKSEKLTQAYLKAFYQSAEHKLPKWQQSHLKRRAKKAVGVPAKTKKSAPTLGQVHVPAPVAGKVKPLKTPKATPHIWVMKGSATEMAYVNQAINLQQPNARAVEGADEMPADALASLEANRLVQGMDMELASGSLTPQQARAAASRNLVESPGCYDQVGASDAVLGDVGVMLDLGSGPSRAVGHLGIDLAPYDYGTVLWDLDLGIPFPDACCRAVRMTHSLHPMLDAYGEMRSPLAILLEVQRVLKEGGQFFYEGPEPLYEKGDPWPIPGLAIVSDSFESKLSNKRNAPVVQTFKRIPLAVPAFPGADARFAPAPPMPVDAAMAMLALNASPAETAMANFVGKSAAPTFVPIVKADSEKQIVYGEVLNPLTIDSQNDWLTPADIEKAAHEYMMTSRVIGSEHGEPIGASVVESFIAPQDLNFDGPQGHVSVPKGTWLIGVKVSDPKEWALVKSGAYSGFSVGGVGVREFGMPDALAA